MYLTYMETRIIVLGDTIRVMTSDDLKVLTIAGESPEDRIERKITSDMIEAIKVDRDQDFYAESREKFKDRWKGANGPGSTAPIKRGRR